VQKMLHLALSYSEILQHTNEQTRIAQNEFHDKITQFTSNDLIETFVEQKKTGIDRPGKYPIFLIYESNYFIIIFFSILLDILSYSFDTIRRNR
jgi:hypothetical protein